MNVESEFKLKCCFCSLWVLALTEIKGTVHIWGFVALSLYFCTASSCRGWLLEPLLLNLSV